MKVDKKTITGVVLAIGGVFFVLWLLTKSRSASSGNPGDTAGYPDAANDSQPSIGDTHIPNLPDVGDLPRPRAVVAPAPAAAAGGCCDQSGCRTSGYVESVGPLKIPAAYMESATEAVQSFIRSQGSTTVAPVYRS